MTQFFSLRWVLVVAMVCIASTGFGGEKQAAEYDVVVYGGTSGGVAAAVQCSRMGRSVIVIEPSQHLGGLSSGGLGATDIGNKGAIGGISREFYKRLGSHYGKDEAWTFEPHVAEAVFQKMVAEEEIPVVLGERLDLQRGVEKSAEVISTIRMESGKRFAGKMFIDATYEGDLMALAGVSYHVGRESNATYDESLNGVATQQDRYHQFEAPIDPYIAEGDPQSGLLPGIHAGGPGEEGSGDHRIQAYCFRMCLTDDPENRMPFPKPEGYDPLRYELLLRYLKTGHWTVLGLSKGMPNRKTDTNNKGAFATDNIGMNYEYPEGDYATREAIVHEHEVYQKGLMWFLANDPRVPENVQKDVNRWGLAKDEFTDNGGWPHQLYVREARRMISDYVMTEHDCVGGRVPDDAVGLAAYTMDSHHVQRYVDANGHARNEGDVQVGGFPPYPISYQSIRPKAAECTNLLVPVCVSSSHIAFGSIRMEPVFMVLGQSAATAAVMAIETQTTIQDVDITALQERLEQDGQVLEWTAPPDAGGRRLSIKSLPGIVVDDSEAKLEGFRGTGYLIGPFVGHRYLHDGNEGKGTQSATFLVNIPESGQYEVRIGYSANPNRATNVPVTIWHGDEEEWITLNQRNAGEIDGIFQPVGTYDFKKGTPAVIRIGNEETNGFVMVDAVQLVRVEE